MATPFSNAQNNALMSHALAQARRAFRKGEVPIGAVVVSSQGRIIGRGYNRVETKKTQLAHAEVQAIARACKAIGDWRLAGCWIYVTLEPCSMCMGLLLQSRVDGVVFGAHSPLFGYSLDKNGLFQLYKMNTIQVVAGIGADEAAQLLKQFFIMQREAKSGRGKKPDTF